MQAYYDTGFALVPNWWPWNHDLEWRIWRLLCVIMLNALDFKANYTTVRQADW